MAMPSPPPPRTGLGPPPSLEGLSALMAKGDSSEAGKAVKAAAAEASSSRSNPSHNRNSVPAMQTLSTSSSQSALMSPNHPANLRKQARTDLDPNFTVKSYIGGANALLDKAKSADAQGQAEQAFVNYLKCADVATNIPKHADWPRVAQEKGPTYYRYQDFMKNVPDIIQRGHRLEELLMIRENARAQEALDAVHTHSSHPSFVEEPMEGGVGGTDASDEVDGGGNKLADRLSALRVTPSESLLNSKRMSKSLAMNGNASHLAHLSSQGVSDTATSSSHGNHTMSNNNRSPMSTSSSYTPESPDRTATEMMNGLASPQLERAGFAD